MIHFGDICKMDGAKIPVVDIITFGAPCQDLSVAGNRKGMLSESRGDAETTRSGLFFEAIRIIKEMRENDRRVGRTGFMVRPRFAVYENVPGAFSSNKGKDFQAVLTEIVKIVEPDAPDVPLPDKGKWSHSGCLYDELGRWSVAWRVHDAQFWGVPQRRKRIALVADFGGLAAPEILFERKGLSRDSEPCGEAGQETAGAAGGGVDGAGVRILNPQDSQGNQIADDSGVYPTLRGCGGAGYQQGYCLDNKAGVGVERTSWGIDHVITTGGNCTAQGPCVYEEVEATLKAAGPHSVFSAISFQERAGKPGGGKGILIQNERTGALSTLNNQNVFCLNDQGGSVMAFAQNQVGEVRVSPMSGTLNTNSNASGRNSPLVYDARGNGDGKTVCTITGDHQNRVTDYTALCMDVGFFQTNVEKCGALLARQYKDPPITVGTLCAESYPGKLAPQDVQSGLFPVTNAIVRRLTPLECERLQGYPSKKMVDVSQMTKDEYIAWNLAEGNIIANQERGKVYGTRGPGGCPYKEPKELKGSDVNGYKVVSIRNGATKLQCRVHRIIWISARGIIPDGYVIDHINNDKTDNRLENLQLLTPEQNSQKAQADGLYKSGLDNKATKLDPDLKDEIAFLYEYSDLTMRNLAELYGVSKSRIAQIVHEVGWTDIGEWTDSKGKKHKEADSPRYKALGNSIALPFWAWMARRICAQYERPMTMGSLFDGIGGFPLVFERAGAKAVWASEIEEFPIAVTKKHFPEEVGDDA